MAKLEDIIGQLAGAYSQVKYAQQGILPSVPVGQPGALPPNLVYLQPGGAPDIGPVDPQPPPPLLSGQPGGLPWWVPWAAAAALGTGFVLVLAVRR